MSNVKLDTPVLAEKYDKVSDSQFEDGLQLINELAITKGQQILDIGCGTGRLSSHVAKILGNEGRFYGLDPSEYRINIARQKIRSLNLKNAVLDVGYSDDMRRFEDNSFDTVYLNVVFHWIENKKKTLAEIYRVLKPGGYLGITTGAKEDPGTLKVVTDKILQHEKYAARVNWKDDPSKSVTKDELGQLLDEQGFKISKLYVKKGLKYFGTPQEFIEFGESSSFGTFLTHVPISLRQSVRSDITDELKKRQTEKGIEFVRNLIFAVTQKPD